MQLQDRPNYLGRARHKRAARILPAYSPGSVYKTSHHLIYHLIYEISEQSITASEQDFIFRGAKLLFPGTIYSVV